MKLKPEYSICYDEDDICLTQRLPDGTEREVAPLTASAAMAIEALGRGMDRDSVIDAVMTEFSVQDRDLIAADLDALLAQLRRLDYVTEEPVQ